MFHVEPTPEEAMADEGPEQPHGEPEPPEAANDIAAPFALVPEKLHRSHARRRLSPQNNAAAATARYDAANARK